VVLEGPDEDLLLIGADAARAGRLRGLLDRLLGSQVTLVLSLERDAEALLAYAASAQGQAAGGVAAAPVLAGLDAWLRALPLDQVVTRRIGMSIDAPDDRARPAFLRLAIGRGMLARLLGPLGADADLLDHGCRSLAGRLLQSIGDPAQGRALIGPRLPGALHLAVPPAPPGGGGTGRSSGGGLLVATLGLEEAADPEALLARRASLQRRDGRWKSTG
jgi:hypothetical protein